MADVPSLDPSRPADLLPLLGLGGSAVTQHLRLFGPDDTPIAATCGQVVDCYLRALTERHERGTYSGKSLETATSSLRAFAARFGACAVDSVRQHELTAFVAGLDEWKSPHTKTHRMGFVVTAFRWAESTGLIDRCQFRRDSSGWPTLRPRPPIAPDDYFPLFDMTKRPPFAIHSRTRVSFRRVLWFLWSTGARTAEVFNLRWRDLDLKTGVAILREHKTASTGDDRHIALPRHVRRYLRSLNADRLARRPHATDDELVFPNGRGSAWRCSTFGKQFRKYAQAAGVPCEITPYSLRHGFCLRCLETTTLSDRQIADLLGHETTRYVSWYGRHSRRRTKYLAELADKVKSGRRS